MTAYYNENDPKAAAWLCELIKQNHIAPGVVDTRSIEDVRPSELTEFTQCHFFAGIGGWSLALRLAGWPDDRPVWTGSCPCQPFSAAGKKTGTSDDRHLWPHFHWLIKQCRPVTVFGEQVASKDGLDWLDIVQADLENSDYTSGAVDLCAAGFGAPHIRQRLFWVAHSEINGDRGDAGKIFQSYEKVKALKKPRKDETWKCCDSGPAMRMANTHNTRSQGRERMSESADQCTTGSDGLDGGMAKTHNPRLKQRGETSKAPRHGQTFEPDCSDSRPNPTNGFWRDVDWLGCRDGKWRPVEPASQRMAYGLSYCLGRLRDFSGEEKRRVLNATETYGFREEVLRAVRGGHCPEEIWMQAGGCLGFSEATVLLAILCKQSGELGRFFNCTSSGGEHKTQRFLHLSQNSAFTATRTSQRYQYPQQLIGEFRNTLSELSQTCPHFRKLVNCAERFTAGPLSKQQPAKVVRLRGYGNAIVPQVAAAFIQASEYL